MKEKIIYMSNLKTDIYITVYKILSTLKFNIITAYM